MIEEIIEAYKYLYETDQNFNVSNQNIA